MIDTSLQGRGLSRVSVFLARSNLLYQKGIALSGFDALRLNPPRNDGQRRIHYAKLFSRLVIPEASLEHGTSG